MTTKKTKKDCICPSKRRIFEKGVDSRRYSALNHPGYFNAHVEDATDLYNHLRIVEGNAEAYQAVRNEFGKDIADFVEETNEKELRGMIKYGSLEEYNAAIKRIFKK